MSRRGCLCLVWCAVVVYGCGSGTEIDRFPVTGTVTLDGAPLDNGTIRLLDPNGGADGGAIANGTFSLRATAGSKRVEIEATQESTKEVEGKEGTGITQIEHLVPAQYNRNSSLTAEISADEPNELEFELKSAP